MRFAQIVIFVFFVQAHFLIFVFESEGQLFLKEDLMQVSTLMIFQRSQVGGIPRTEAGRF